MEKKTEDNGLLPDIFTLPRTTPGGYPKRPEVPKTAHNPIDQVLPTSYFAHQMNATEGGPGIQTHSSDSSSSESRIEVRNSVMSNREFTAYVQRSNASKLFEPSYGRGESILISVAFSILIFSRRLYSLRLCAFCSALPNFLLSELEP